MSDATRLTPEKIAQYRIEFADNENALIALNVIEEWEGDLADAQAFIYFIDDKAQRILYDSFITEIGHKIGKNLSNESHEPLGRHFQSIEEAIKQYEAETGSSIDQQALGKSRLLVRNLTNPNLDYQGRKEIQLS
ncbi:hypothetical protein EZJ55_24165 [Microcystis aeruginosa EAWAG127a]|jgi:aromatic ring-cleaving dioxygenase|uniref:Uncharacterized protein n=1 Tax=Microcystis aeruginosa EAWAG127a TaxID=2529855 RepID=A0A5J5LZJ3_MICAE|nr:hypothetical protein [Microcystis aeruginosa]KAB0239414.1 hypothetical protein EZJ55_01060 [Microcystis aeruginosa EAWAG127a]KAB0243184.1 hypothetical protein EZJ55_24165 [Microcystis aeruginosa EAWAG127a]